MSSNPLTKKEREKKRNEEGEGEKKRRYEGEEEEIVIREKKKPRKLIEEESEGRSRNINDIKLPEGWKLCKTQEEMIIMIDKTLDAKENALIESPTGSGKTIAILLSTVGWLRRYKKKMEKARERCEIHSQASGKENEPHIDINGADGERRTCCCLPRVVIYYASRTHKQLEHVVKELRRLGLGDEIKHVVLGSRQHSCINKEVRNKEDRDKLCRKLNADTSGGCYYKMNMKKGYETGGAIRQLIKDKKGESCFTMASLSKTLEQNIEDLPQLCPYYASKNMHHDADIIFCPYNYLISAGVRKHSGMQLYNAIAIIDEAHNIEDQCRDAASFSFDEEDGYYARKHFEEMRKKVESSLEEENGKFDGDKKLISMLEEREAAYKMLVEAMEEKERWMRKAWDCSQGSVDKVRAMQRAFQESGIRLEGWSETERKINVALGKLTMKEDEDPKYSMLKYKPSEDYVWLVEDWTLFMSYCSANPTEFSLSAEGIKKDYNYRSSNFTFKTFLNDHDKAVIECICLNARVAFSDAISNCRNVILASGTLSPFEPLIAELGTNFKNLHYGEQVIPRNQMFAAIVKKGPSKIEMHGIHDNLMKDIKMQDEIGSIIKSVCDRVVGGGAIVFLPSYDVMDKLKMRMDKSGILQWLHKEAVIFENRNSDRFDVDIQEYVNAASSYRSAVLFAVFRGKAAEGADFKDALARCIITIGIPYARSDDPKVVEKKKYNDSRPDRKFPRGSVWYDTHAYRALNQALGRGLRHRDDWCAHVMVDSRLNVHPGGNGTTRLSRWINESAVSYEDYNQFEKDLKEFMRDRR